MSRLRCVGELPLLTCSCPLVSFVYPAEESRNWKKRLASLNLSARTVQRLVQEYREQSAREATAGNVNMSRKRDQYGGHTMKLTEDLAKELISTNSKTWERLSCKAFAGKREKRGHQVSRESVRYWCKALGASGRRRYIKPKLMLRHKHQRLLWAVSMYDKRRRRFLTTITLVTVTRSGFSWCGMVRCGEFFSWVHCDRWGCRRGTSVNVEWPEDFSQDKNSEGHVPGCDSSPSSSIRIWWKGWLVALRCYDCCPQIWQAYWTYRRRDANVTNCECRCSWVSKGHVTETWCLLHDQEEDVVVRSVLRQARSGTNNFLPARWQLWSRHGKMKGFHIEVTGQPAQSPDLNTNDLAFFASL